MVIQMDMFTQAHRDHDPVTSVMAAASVQTRAGTHKYMLLVCYAKALDAGLTDEEAGIESGLHEKRADYWRRCTDLRALGLIRPTGGWRLSRFHERRMVCVITEEGQKVLEGVQE